MQFVDQVLVTESPLEQKALSSATNEAQMVQSLLFELCKVERCQYQLD